MERRNAMKRNMLVFWITVIVGPFFVPLPARASYASVDCAGITQGAFPSINAALSYLDSTSPDDPNWNWIEVRGTCSENVRVYDHYKLGIVAALGETVTIVSPTPSAPALGFYNSRNIYLYGLVLTGGSNGLEASNSQVTAEKLTAEHNSSSGISVNDQTLLRLTSAELRNNNWTGLSTNSLSVVEIFPSGPEGGLRVTNNAGPGLWIYDSWFGANGSITIENNGGPAADTAGSLITIGSGTGPNIVRDNKAGILVQGIGNFT